MRRLALLTGLLLSGCSMNPRLSMPSAPVAPVYQAAMMPEAGNAADLGWREMFGDPRLQRLIALALTDSRDLRIAVLNVETARTQARIQRSNQLPQLNATGGYTRQRTPATVAGAGLGVSPDQGGQSGFEVGQFSAQAALSAFEIDLFGRLRSQSQAAFERYLASDEGRRATQIALIGSVVDAYLNERLAEEQLRLTDVTLADWQRSLALTRKLRAAAQNSGLEVAQAEGQVRQAEADMEERRRTLAQARNALTLVVGAELPADLPPPMSLMDQPIPTQLPAGLPSDLLERRPDIRQAEHELVASNADIGAARAAFFPRLSLTAAFGFSSLALRNLFTGDNQSWSFSPQVAMPIFQGGQLKGNLDLATIRKSVAVATYERTIQTAFREVSDGLAARATFDRQQESQGKATQVAARRLHLSELRYKAGVDSRIEMLDAQRSSYAAQRTLLEVRRSNLSAMVGLYRALGGGLHAGAQFGAGYGITQ